MHQALSILNRYKFTLIYGVVFWLLGGMTLAVPAVLGGLVVDKLMNRPDLKVDYKITKYTAGFWILFIFVLVFIYPLFLFNGVLNLMMPFTDRMAEHIPAVNRYGELVGQLGYHGRVEYVRHLFAAYWFWGLILVPLIYGDVCRWIKVNIKNDFFTRLQGQEIPGTLNALMQNKGIEAPLSFDNPKHVAIMYICGLLCIVMCLGFLYLMFEDSFYGAETMTKSQYYGRSDFTWLPLFITALPTIILFIILSMFILTKRLIHFYTLNQSVKAKFKYKKDKNDV